MLKIVKCFYSKVRPVPKSQRLEPGNITKVQLKSGKYITLYRPKSLNTVHIDIDKLDKSISKYQEEYDFNKLTNNDQYFPEYEEFYNTQSDVSVTELMSHPIHNKSQTLDQLVQSYLKLGKVRLTTLVVISTAAGWFMAPIDFQLPNLMLCLSGTFLLSMAANSINQLMEIPYDSQMKRTRNRPLVLGTISPVHAATFAAIASTTGLSLLAQCNVECAVLGLANLFIYTALYTPMKRVTIANTWVGSCVGAIPPLIGWTALTADFLQPGGLLIAALLYSWQFPHFMSLSWNLRQDYSRAGYQMTSVTRPKLCKASSLRHSLALPAICAGISYYDLCNWWFFLESSLFNAVLIVLAIQFYRYPNSSNSRRLFLYTLIQLPVVILLMILNKTRTPYKEEESNV